MAFSISPLYTGKERVDLALDGELVYIDTHDRVQAGDHRASFSMVKGDVSHPPKLRLTNPLTKPTDMRLVIWKRVQPEDMPVAIDCFGREGEQAWWLALTPQQKPILIPDPKEFKSPAIFPYKITLPWLSLWNGTSDYALDFLERDPILRNHYLAKDILPKKFPHITRVLKSNLHTFANGEAYITIECEGHADNVIIKPDISAPPDPLNEENDPPFYETITGRQRKARKLLAD